MVIGKLKEAVEKKRIEWKKHVLERMLERGISRADVFTVLLTGKIIESYGSDRPFPSYLILGYVGEHPIHVVVAYDDKSETCYIVTVYRPDLQHFDADCMTRKKR